MKIFEMKAERAKVATEAREIVDKAIAEKRDNTPEEWQQVESLQKRHDDWDRKIQVAERFDAGKATEAERRSDPQQFEDRDGPELDGKHKYSLMRAMRCQLGEERGGLEVEVSQHIQSRTGITPKGIYVPWNLATHRDAFRGVERRDLSTTTGSGSIANILGTSLIDLLRNKTVMNRMGATTLSDMTGGTFSLPKQTAAGTAYYVAEGVNLTNSNPTIGQVTWTPKTLGARYPTTRKFMLQTNQDSEALLRNDLTRVLAIEMDRAGINGSGQNTQPLGICQDPNVTIVPIGTNGGDPTWGMVVNLEGTVAAANADFGRMGYLSSNQGRAKMKATPKVSNFPIFLWEKGQGGDMGEVNGYNALATQNVPVNLTKGSNNACTALIFGNFESATYAMWGGLDILLDPYSASASGGVIINAYTDFDFQFRWEQSFAKTVDMNQS